MLVLTRKPGEKVIVEGRAEVRCVECGRETVLVDVTLPSPDLDVEGVVQVATAGSVTIGLVSGASRPAGGVLRLRLSVDQAVVIGDDVVVTLTQVSPGSGARLAFRAPRSVAIHRSELIDQIREQNAAATATSKAALSAATPTGRPAPARVRLPSGR